jgi:group I intron endonuclease
MIIYKIENQVNGKVYIGKTEKSLTERYSKHLSNAKKKINRHLYDSMNHYGYDKFEVSVVEECKSSSELSEREKYWIQYYDSISPKGYNMTEGGDGGYTLSFWTDEQRKKLYQSQSSKRIGKKRDDSFRKLMSEKSKIRESNKTEEQKIQIKTKISETLKSKYKSGEILPTTPKLYGEDHPQYVSIDIDDVLNSIKNGMKLVEIAEKYNTTTATVGSRLKKQTGKTFIEWRKHYGISGTFRNPKTIDSSGQ